MTRGRGYPPAPRHQPQKDAMMKFKLLLAAALTLPFTFALSFAAPFTLAEPVSV